LACVLIKIELKAIAAATRRRDRRRYARLTAEATELIEAAKDFL